MSKWEFVEQRIDDPNIFKGNDLQIMDSAGSDLTETIIRNPDFQFLLIAWDLEKSDKEALKQINIFAEKALSADYGFIGLTSSLSEVIDSTRVGLKLNFDFYMADDITLKVMVRANPGMVLMKDGVILDKWHYNDFPSYSEFEEKYSIPAVVK
jgi:hypothetical protein